jgi:hypothetical protein
VKYLKNRPVSNLQRVSKTVIPKMLTNSKKLFNMSYKDVLSKWVDRLRLHYPSYLLIKDNHVPECFLTTNCKAVKYVGNKKSLFLVITSLTFLISGAICSQLSVHPAFGVEPDPCFDLPCLNRKCENNEGGSATCCWQESPGGDVVCQTCHVNTDTGEFENCSDVGSIGKPGAGVLAPPPSGVAPPPPTESCPENTARDAQGNCTPLTQTPETPVPKSGLGNLLPEGVFEGPASPEEVPQGAPPTAEDGSEQPPNQPLCPEGQVLDEDTNLCFRVSQEQEEQQQQSEVTEEKQPVPVCQEGLEFNEDLGFCVPTECPEGQELNEQAGICVLEEPEVADVPEQSEPEEPEQPSSEGDGSQDNGNNDDN